MERILSALIYQLDQIRVFGVDRERMSACIKTLQEIQAVLRKGPATEGEEAEKEAHHEPNQ